MNNLVQIRYLYLFTIFSVFALLYAPGLLGAQATNRPTGASNQQAAKLENPLAFNSIGEFVAGALQALVLIALPIVGFFILLSGFLFISARGNKEQLAKAKTNFMWVIAGSILILGAWALAQLIEGTVNQLRA